jgi:hypothetical protein
MTAHWILGLSLALVLAGGCHRNVEPFDPDEQVVEPDLSAIFPEAAERSNASRRSASPAMPMRELRGGMASGPPLTGRILLAPELAGRVPRGAVLFLIARSGGSGRPIAVKLIPAPEFPLEFEIGPDDRMSRETSFEGLLQLSARVDADGDAATRTAGDLQGVAEGAHAPGTTGVTILIDEML